MSNFVKETPDSDKRRRTIFLLVTVVAVAVSLFLVLNHYILLGLILIVAVTIVGEFTIALLERNANILGKVSLVEADALMVSAQDKGLHITGRDAAFILRGGVHSVTADNGEKRLITLSDDKTLIVWSPHI